MALITSASGKGCWTGEISVIVEGAGVAAWRREDVAHRYNYLNAVKIDW